MTILATIIVLGVLIFVHELGHFWAARSVGVRVDRFSIGLGPKVFGFQRGDTEYVISAIPLGGYVKMGGMEDEVMESIEGGKVDGEATGGPDATDPASRAAPPADIDPDDPFRAPPSRLPPVGVVARDRSTDFDAKPVWARAWVISAGVIMNFLFAFLAYTVVAAGWGSAEPDTLRVGDIRAEVLPVGVEDLARIPPGAEIIAVGDRTPAHWGQVIDAILELPTGPITIRHTGSEGAVHVALPEERASRERIARSMEIWTDPVVLNVTPGSPAARGGLTAGDRILEVDGVPLDRWGSFTRAIQQRPERATEIVVERDGRTERLEVVPEAVQAADAVTGAVRTIGRIGVLSVLPETAWSPLGITDAIGYGARQTWGLTVFIVDFLGQLLTGRASPRNLGSIVTIGEASGQAAQEGFPVFLSFMALLSINLAILNLLPIPVLDGGHLVFLALEAIRGRPVSIEQRMRWSQVGFVVLIGIMVLALGNDFLRLFGL